MPIFLIGKSLPGSLTAWIEAAARRIRSRHQSQPRFKGIVRPAAGQKGREEEPSELGRLFPSPFLAYRVPSLWENSPSYPAREKIPGYFHPTHAIHAILLLPGKSKLLSTATLDPGDR